MKSTLYKIMTLAALIASTSACNDSPEYPMQKTGQVSLESLGVEVQNVERVIAKSPTRATYDLNPFIVTIYNDKGIETQSWTYGEMPEIFTLPVGHYRVDVRSHNILPAEWDRPYFVGSQEFDIVAAQITEVNKVVCKFASLKVSVEFDDKLREAMADDIQVRVVAGESGELIYDANTTSAGYFEVVEGSTTLVATFTGKVLGYNEYIQKTINDVEAGQHRIIRFTLKNNIVQPEDETGYIDPSQGITISTDVYDQELSGSAGIEEPVLNPGDRPGEEQFSESVTMDYNEATQMLGISAPEGLRSLTVGVSTDNDDLAAAIAVLNGIDLASSTSAAAASQFGLPSPTQVAGATNLNVDLSTLLAKCAEYPGKHSVIFTGYDAKDASSAYRVTAPGKVVEAQVSFESEKLSFTEPMNVSDFSGAAGEGVVNIKVPNGIAHLNVDIASTNNDFLLSLSDLNFPSTFDLAYPGANEEAIAGLGLVVGSQVIDQTEVPFDITQFIPLLGAFPGTHTFTIAVTDNSGAVKSAQLIFLAQ